MLSIPVVSKHHGPGVDQRKVFSMAKKTSGPNKSQAIRDYYASHPDAKPKQVVEALANQGVDVSAAFVSTIKSTSITKGPKRTKGAKRGPKPGPRSVKATRGVGRPSTRGPGAPARSGSSSGGSSVSIDNLIKAKGLVRELGGIDNAINTLTALKRLAD
jgi:hypothetical protein